MHPHALQQRHRGGQKADPAPPALALEDVPKARISIARIFRTGFVCFIFSSGFVSGYGFSHTVMPMVNSPLGAAFLSG
jgi:hypothetical protein